MCFTDKRLLFRALRQLGWKPENRIWAEYQSVIGKKLGVGGNIIGKLLTAVVGHVNIFFTESNEGLTPHFESSKLNPHDLQQQANHLLLVLKKEYLRCVVHEFASEIRNGGGYAAVNEEERNGVISFVVTIGDSSRNVTVSMEQDGTVREEVTGVAGRSCDALTKSLERRLSVSQDIVRQWTHEYSEVVEDQVIQVLRLE